MTPGVAERAPQADGCSVAAKPARRRGAGFPRAHSCSMQMNRELKDSGLRARACMQAGIITYEY